VLKVVQLEELIHVRHSVFVIGNPGTGKTKILRSLNRTYHNMKRKPIWQDLNPKAVTNDELFGYINPATREWKDGEKLWTAYVQLCTKVACLLARMCQDIVMCLCCLHALRMCPSLEYEESYTYAHGSLLTQWLSDCDGPIGTNSIGGSSSTPPIAFL